MEEISLKDNGAKRKGKATVRLRRKFRYFCPLKSPMETSFILDR